jgi:hypothetical protein
MKSTNVLSQRPMLGRLPGMDTSSHLRTASRPASEQVWQAFLAALRELPPDARAILLLHDVLGAGFEDIVPCWGSTLPRAGNGWRRRGATCTHNVPAWSQATHECRNAPRGQ